MDGYQLRQSLHAGQRVFGTLTVSDAPRWPAVLATLGLDFIFIDTEHVTIDRKPLSWMCQTYAGLGMAPIVRIPAPDPYLATMALDAGAHGIIAPYVETVEQVKALSGAVKFRPLKGRRLQELLDGAALDPAERAYLDNFNRNHVLVINVESVPAMEGLEELVAGPGLDAVLIGPHDLSVSLGIPEQYDHPEFDRAVTSIIRRSRAAGVSSGFHLIYGSALTLERELRWIGAGANFIIHRADIIAARMKLSEELQELRAALQQEGHALPEADFTGYCKKREFNH